MGFTITTTVDLDVGAAVEAVRAALADQGFGILTEFDLAATLTAKLGVEIPAQVVLGACHPPLAHAALQAERSIGVLLPCNVVVRAGDDGRTVIESLEPTAMVTVTGNDALTTVAEDAATRLRAALATVGRV